MSQSLKEATEKDLATAFGKFSLARICLNHTNRTQQWTKQINHIEDRALKVRLSHLDREQSQHLDREAAVRRRLADSVNRLRAVQQVFRQYSMEDISGVVRGGDFQVAVSRFVDDQVNKKLDFQNRARRRQGRINRRFERSQNAFNVTLGRLTSMDLSIKSPILQRGTNVSVESDRPVKDRRNLDNFSLPYLMLNPMLVAEVEPSQMDDLTEEQLAELEDQRQGQFKEALAAAYNIDVRASPTENRRSKSPSRKCLSHPSTSV